MSDSTVVDSKTSTSGMSGLGQDDFEPALLTLISDWLTQHATNYTIPIVACGMVGAQQGWVEAGYTPTPCAPGDIQLAKPLVKDPRICVTILSGISQDSPADVMRGEETQIAGFLTCDPTFSGLLCMPGTHSKWVHLTDGHVTRFTTLMTGEVYGILCEHSVLSHIVDPDGQDHNHFAEGILQGSQNPESVLADLFSLRAEAILNGVEPGQIGAKLSGLLIGNEISSMKDLTSSEKVTLVGSGVLSQLYIQAFLILGTDISTVDADQITIRGLNQVRDTMMRDGEKSVS